MTVCDFCNQEMKKGNGCKIEIYDDFGDGKEYDRIPAEHKCHDCNVGSGELHHPGCDDEKCPKCRGQAISCDCIDVEESY